MLERFIKTFVRLVTSTFFRRIHVVGAQNIPPDGPVIFAGNHPNALMDGWLLTATCGRWPLHFMGNAKLWNYRLLGPLLDASGAVPVYPRDEYGENADNSDAFDKLYEVLEAGGVMGVFPEGISHAESHLAELKTGTARIALSVADRGATDVTIVPCGLNYIHRHRFRSQVLIEFGNPIVVGEEWTARYREDAEKAVRDLTADLAASLKAVTLNAPDWNTLRFAQTTRRLYKPGKAKLTPAEYVELNRRFINGWDALQDNEELRAFRVQAEEYQARLDMLGLRDHQLRNEISLPAAMRKILSRGLTVLLLLPFAAPGAIIHLPGAIAIAVLGNRFAYDMDDVATIKVFATVLITPILYILVAVAVGVSLGFWWGLAVLFLLGFSFFATTYVLAIETTLLYSMLSVLRLARLRSDVEELQKTRAALVARIRDLVDRLTDPDIERIFKPEDFSN